MWKPDLPQITPHELRSISTILLKGDSQHRHRTIHAENRNTPLSKIAHKRPRSARHISGGAETNPIPPDQPLEVSPDERKHRIAEKGIVELGKADIWRSYLAQISISSGCRCHKVFLTFHLAGLNAYPCLCDNPCPVVTAGNIGFENFILEDFEETLGAYTASRLGASQRVGRPIYCSDG